MQHEAAYDFRTRCLGAVWRTCRGESKSPGVFASGEWSGDMRVANRTIRWPRQLMQRVDKVASDLNVVL